MMNAKKFSTQIDEQVLEDLKLFSKETDSSISKIVNDAVKDYIGKAQIRPIFTSAMSDVIEENSELLEILAK